MYEDVVNQKCHFCDEMITGSQQYMVSGKNLPSKRGYAPRWLKERIEYKWAWNGLGDYINNEKVDFIFYLCPEHQTDKHWNGAFKWAQSGIDKAKAKAT